MLELRYQNKQVAEIGGDDARIGDLKLVKVRDGPVIGKDE